MMMIGVIRYGFNPVSNFWEWIQVCKTSYIMLAILTPTEVRCVNSIFMLVVPNRTAMNVKICTKCLLGTRLNEGPPTINQSKKIWPKDCSVLWLWGVCEEVVKTCN